MAVVFSVTFLGILGIFEVNVCAFKSLQSHLEQACTKRVGCDFSVQADENPTGHFLHLSLGKTLENRA